MPPISGSKNQIPTVTPETPRKCEPKNGKGWEVRSPPESENKRERKEMGSDGGSRERSYDQARSRKSPLERV